MGYIGNQTSNSYTSITKQDITGDGGTGYTLDHAVANAQEIEVFVNNVRQEPGAAYTVSGTTLTMTGNVASTDDFYVVFQGKAIQTTVPPDDSVTTARINDGAVTTAKLADSAVTTAKLPAGTILQIKSAEKTDKQSFNATSYTTVTDLSVTITPSSTSSKILVTGNVAYGPPNGERLIISMFRGGTNLANHSSTLSNRTAGFIGSHPGVNNDLWCNTMVKYDSPATTSAITYTVKAFTSGGTAYFNASFTDTDAATVARGISSITVMEIAG